MKTPVRRRPTIVRLYPVLIGLMVLIAAVLMAPAHSADSRRLRSGKENVTTKNLKTTKGDLANRFRHPKWISAVNLPAMAGETVELFAQDCSTPLTDMNLGEIVCAKTDGVDLTIPNNHYIVYTDSQLNETNGGKITQNPQFFYFTPPTTGVWKANIGRVAPPEWSIIGNPPLFTVNEGVGVATYAANCTTPQSTFTLGDVVCAKVSGANQFNRLFGLAG